MKKILLMITTLSLLFGMTSMCYAENYNVSTEPSVETATESEEGITPYYNFKPEEVWNLAQNGRYYFSGYAEGSTLYTNYRFTGVSAVRIETYNNSNETLIVRLHKIGWFDPVVRESYVVSGCSLYYIIDGLDPNSEYYIEFSAPSDFYGYIEEY